LRNIIKRVLALLSVKVTLINKKNTLNELGVNTGNADFLPNGAIWLKDFDLKVNQDRHGYILRGVRIMYSLRNKAGAKFELTAADDLLINVNGLIYNIQTWEELFILNEIFISGVYNYLTTEPFVLFDIGMNVAYSSLFFAAIPECLAVYSFEPFQQTFDQAVHNISLNPEAAKKIHPFNYGLGKDNRQMTVAYDKDIKGNMGINGIPGYLDRDLTAATEEQIILKDAAAVISGLISELGTARPNLVVKMDCEGSEYDILESVGDAGLLKAFSVIMMEWHFKGNAEICSRLQNAGYSLFSFNHHDEMSGMLYAFKNKFE